MTGALLLSFTPISCSELLQNDMFILCQFVLSDMSISSAASRSGYIIWFMPSLEKRLRLSGCMYSWLSTLASVFFAPRLDASMQAVMFTVSCDVTATNRSHLFTPTSIRSFMNVTLPSYVIMSNLDESVSRFCGLLSMIIMSWLSERNIFARYFPTSPAPAMTILISFLLVLLSRLLWL